MIKKKYMVLSFLVFCLTATLLVSVTSSAEYDPWADINGDGLVNIWDLSALSDAWLTTGTPIHKKGNISVPAAAFVPRSHIQSWVISGGGIRNKDPSYLGEFVTDVQLPHGATVTNVTFYWRDFGDDYVTCHLERTSTLYVEEPIAYPATSTGNTLNMGSSYNDTIFYPVVDNDHHAYYLKVVIPPDPTGETYVFRAAFIEYEYLP